MDPLLALCRERGIAVIEDACQAHGALYKGRPVGSLGDAGCFSFYPTKNLGGWGDGGALVTSDPALDAKVRLLRSHGEGTRHHHELATGTHRLDTLQAAILEVKLRHLPAWNQRRRDAAAALRSGLAGSSVIAPAPARGRQRPRLPPLRRPQRPSATRCATTSTPAASPARSTTRRRSTCSRPTPSSGSAGATCRWRSGLPPKTAPCRSSRRSRTGRSRRRGGGQEL